MNEIKPPLTPEQLKGIANRDKEIGAQNRTVLDQLFIAKKDKITLLAHIESQARRVEEVEKERDYFLKQTEETCPDCGYMRNAHGICKCGLCSVSNKNLRNQLSLAHEAIRVKDALLIERASEGCEGSHGYGNCVERDRAEGDKSEWCQPCRCQAALSPAGSGGGDDKKRLDWLEKANAQSFSPLWSQDWIHIRSAIDAAMQPSISIEVKK